MRLKFSPLFYAARENGMVIQDPLSRIFTVNDHKVSERMNIPVDPNAVKRDPFLRFCVGKVSDFPSGEVVVQVKKKPQKELSPELTHFTRVYV